MVNLQIFKYYDPEYMKSPNIWRFYNDETDHFEVVTGKLIGFRVRRGNTREYVHLVFEDKTYIARRDLSYTQIHGYDTIDEFINYNNSPEYTYCHVSNMGKTVKAFQKLLNECTDYKGEVKPWKDYKQGEKVYIIRYDYSNDCPYVCESTVLEVYRNEINTPDFYFNFNMVTDYDYIIGSSREECLYVNRNLLVKKFAECKLEAEVANKYLKENIQFINKFYELR
jgi:hypothetical protein